MISTSSITTPPRTTRTIAGSSSSSSIQHQEELQQEQKRHHSRHGGDGSCCCSLFSDNNNNNNNSVVVAFHGVDRRIRRTFFSSSSSSSPPPNNNNNNNNVSSSVDNSSSTTSSSSNNNGSRFLTTVTDDDAALRERISSAALQPQTSVSLQALMRTGRGEYLHKTIPEEKLLQTAQKDQQQKHKHKQHHKQHHKQQSSSSSSAGATELVLIQVASFLRRELPIRLAHRIHDLENVPILRDMKHVRDVRDLYITSFVELTSFEPTKISTVYDEMRFATLLETIYERHSKVLVQMAKGAYEFRSAMRNQQQQQQQQQQYSSSHAKMSNGQFIQQQQMHPPELELIQNESDTHAFLDRFYLCRIGIRVLIGQYLALRQPHVENYIGIICSTTSPYNIVQRAIDDASFMCSRKYGDSPEVIISGRLDKQFPYVPTHLHYIMLELLKNSMRATVEWHSNPDRYQQQHQTTTTTPSSTSSDGNTNLSSLSKTAASFGFGNIGGTGGGGGIMSGSSSSSGLGSQMLDICDFPPIKVIIADGDENEDVVIKVSDEGGGIPRSNMTKIWSYLFTTADPSIQDGMMNTNGGGQQHQGNNNNVDHGIDSPLAGLGYGLPISRSYCRYFGGDLSIMSMEGYGTDAFVHLTRLGTTKEPLPI